MWAAGLFVATMTAHVERQRAIETTPPPLLARLTRRSRNCRRLTLTRVERAGNARGTFDALSTLVRSCRSALAGASRASASVQGLVSPSDAAFGHDRAEVD